MLSDDSNDDLFNDKDLSDVWSDGEIFDSDMAYDLSTYKRTHMLTDLIEYPPKPKGMNLFDGISERYVIRNTK
jgi:hypothetical protein